MHVDFVEEAYWKRAAAKKFANDCAAVALHRAKLRTTRNQIKDLEDKQRAVLEEARRVEIARREEDRQKLAEKKEKERQVLREARQKAEDDRLAKEKEEQERYADYKLEILDVGRK